MKELKKYWAFWIPYIVFLLVLGGLIVWNEKAELHLWLNSAHTSFCDVFFKYYTAVGEWIPFVVAAGLLLYRFRAALLVLAAQLMAGGVTQVLKRTFDIDRPSRFFAEYFPDVQLPVVEGVRLHSSHSFPSGHTTSAFALFLALAFLTKRKEWQCLYCLLAILVGYSRIYLSQHFASDVWMGSLVGVVMTAVTLWVVDRWHPAWYGKSLLNCAGKEN